MKIFQLTTYLKLEIKDVISNQNNKVYRLKKKEIKLFLFTEDLLFYIGNPKESTEKAA